ncbi:uncharacterized protein LOC131015672 isoform X2 [Salvia miltiorrhiza]|uniref:uncharacterized protein LOC131015672 isoform X2 n=1 Tax=Salvia miltiorrhiza TaxID=226208 RepID=UPI0025AC3120|nr:uncharacterized protein LOC131015672 isoform X2 [Salvia miltiorrhiza]
MARRSSRIQEVDEKNEVNCMWGLLSILESCQGRPSHKVISNGRAANRNIIDYPRPLDAIACFDEECRKIHNGAGLRSSVGVEGKGRGARGCIGGEMPVEQHTRKRDVVKRQQHAKMDGELVDQVTKSHRKTRKSSQGVYQSSSPCCSSNAARLMNELPSTSAEKSLNKLTLAAILGAVYSQNHQQEIKLSEYLQRSRFLGKYDEVDEINIQHVQMRAKAFLDQTYINRRFVLGEGRSSESKSFSNALEVLSSKRDLFMELLPDPDSLLARRSKRIAEKDTIKSVLSGNVSEYEAMDEANSNNNLWQKIEYQLKYSSRTNFTAQPSDKIVILKPAPQIGKHSGNLTCSCSSLQLPHKSNRRVSEEKTASFSFREIKKKLKHRFGVTKKEPSCNSSSNADKEGEVLRKKELKSSRGSDIARVADTTRRKSYLSSARSSNKEECDVVLEAKRHLSKRLNNVNSVEAVMSKKHPRTLERILSSPEHDFWPFSPRRDSLYCPGSAEMRFSPYSTSPRAFESASHARNELRSDTEVASLQTVDAKAYSLIQRNDISTAEKMRNDDESKSAEMERFLQTESHVSGQVLSETTTKPLEAVETQKWDCIASVAENEAVTSTLHDFPSTCSNNQEEHQSPVSVLEPFFVEDANSPPTITLQTGRKQLQPRRLDFEDCSFESSPPPSAPSSRDEELCQYVHSVMEASSLDWDHLSEIRSPPQELLHESLFDEVELPPLDCYYDPKLLFDHINEVLLQIYKCHFCSPPWLASATPKTTRSAPLAEVVLDEILAEADYFLLPTTERRSLDELVSKDAKCGSWLDVRVDTEHVVFQVSEAVLEESLLDTLLELHASQLRFLHSFCF